MAAGPQFSNAIQNGKASISVANTGRDGSGTIVDFFTAGERGSRVDKIKVIAPNTTTAGIVRIYIHNGTAYFLWKEVLVSAITVSATVAGFVSEIVADCVLQRGWKMGAAPHNAEGFVVHAEGGDF